MLNIQHGMCSLLYECYHNYYDMYIYFLITPIHALVIWIEKKEHQMFAFKIFWCKIIEILSRAKFFI